MVDSHLAGRRPKRWSSLLPYLLSVVVQAVLFLGASAALTLFYLSYRPVDFTPAFIITGLELIAPWLLISLLPTFFGLKDKELRREILLRQLISMLFMVCLLVGLSVSIDFHGELFEKFHSYILKFLSVLDGLWKILAAYISKTISFLTAFINDTLLPFF